MSQTRSYALGLLAGGAALAVATPAYVGYAEPYLAGALHHPVVLLAQVVPYVLLAVLWLPRRDRRSGIVAVGLSALLLLINTVLYVPRLWTPASSGNDMAGIYYIGVSTALVVCVLLGSGVAFAINRWQSARTRVHSSQS